MNLEQINSYTNFEKTLNYAKDIFLEKSPGNYIDYNFIFITECSLIEPILENRFSLNQGVELLKILANTRPNEHRLNGSDDKELKEELKKILNDYGIHTKEPNKCGLWLLANELGYGKEQSKTIFDFCKEVLKEQISFDLNKKNKKEKKKEIIIPEYEIKEGDFNNEVCNKVWNKFLNVMEIFEGDDQELKNNIILEDRNKELKKYQYEYLRLADSSDKSKFEPSSYKWATKEELLDLDVNFEYIRQNSFVVAHTDKGDFLGEHNNMVIEFDTNPNLLDQLKKIFSIYKLPIRTIVFSGDRGFHFKLETGAKDKEEYRFIIEETLKIFNAHLKYAICDGCKDPMHLVRFGGNFRKWNSKGQKNIYQAVVFDNKNYGCANMKEWLYVFKEHNISETKELVDICKASDGKIRTSQAVITALCDKKYSGDFIKVNFKNGDTAAGEDLYFYANNYYQAINYDILENKFCKEIKKPLSSLSLSFDFTMSNYTAGIKNFLKEIEPVEVDESFFNLNRYIVFKNGIYDREKGILRPHTKDIYSNRKLNFNFVENLSLEDLKKIIKEKVLIWWEKNLSFEKFKILLFLHLLNVRYNAVKFCLYMPGVSNTGKTTLNRLLNRMADGPIVAKDMKENSNFNLSGITGETKCVQYDDPAYIKFEIAKQIIGADILPVENKGKNTINVQNNCFLKIISNLTADATPEMFEKNATFFADKLFVVDFNLPLSEEQQTNFLEMGGVDGLIRNYGDVIATYVAVSSNEWFANPKRYMIEHQCFGVNLTVIYKKIILKMIKDPRIFKLEEITDTTHKDENITANVLWEIITSIFQSFGISYAEFGNVQLISQLETMEQFTIKDKYKNRKNSASEKYVIFKDTDNKILKISLTKGKEELKEQIKRMFNKDNCPIDTFNGEELEIEENVVEEKLETKINDLLYKITNIKKKLIKVKDEGVLNFHFGQVLDLEMNVLKCKETRTLQYLNEEFFRLETLINKINPNYKPNI